MKTAKEKWHSMLSGGDLRSIGGANEVITRIHTQEDFDTLFGFLHSRDRLLVMRAADAIEKITRKQGFYLDKHKESLLKLAAKATDKELKWHLAQLMPRLKLSDDETAAVFGLLEKWALDKIESKIVRANSVQALYEISGGNELLTKSFDEIRAALKKENVPSINARIKQLQGR